MKFKGTYVFDGDAMPSRAQGYVVVTNKAGLEREVRRHDEITPEQVDALGAISKEDLERWVREDLATIRRGPAQPPKAAEDAGAEVPGGKE